ncbi:DUF4174 domain-containing protein [Crocosphaera sp. Alani8]|uniref:DUF4174 domain-containing protein n=1 Tax=Crocosphaera sp. Alani8 TaxID=3038952 RepID=UPI00313DA1BE
MNYKKPLALMLSLGTIGIAMSLKSVLAQNNPLESYRWQNRLLLVFVPKVNDARLASIQQTQSSLECEFKDRDLLLGIFANDARSRIGERSLSPYDVAALRAKYGIQSHQFAVILVGKDGQPKSELSEVPEIEQIFGKIDSMPMRQEEMSKNPSPCQG